jgi:hypothetical protein
MVAFVNFGVVESGASIGQPKCKFTSENQRNHDFSGLVLPEAGVSVLHQPNLAIRVSEV